MLVADHLNFDMARTVQRSLEQQAVVAECCCRFSTRAGQSIGEPGGAQGYHDTAVFNHPETNRVDVVFGPCAFGCAEGG